MDYKSLQRRDSNWKQEEGDPRNRRKRTQNYIDSVQPTNHHDKQPVGIVSQMYSSISQFCHDALVSLDNSEEARRMEPMSTPLYRLLDSVYASFITWGNDFHVGNGDLDDALKDSQDLRWFTIKIMIRICDTIENDLHPTMLQILKATHLENCPIQTLESKLKVIQSIKDVANMQRQDHAYDDGMSPVSSASDAESPGPLSDNSSLEEALEMLKCDVEALIELSPALEDPLHDTLTSTDEKAATPQAQAGTEDCNYKPFYLAIKQKFPPCNDALATAISKAICQTTLRLHKERQAAASSHLLGIARPEKPASELFPKDSGYETATRDPTHMVDDIPVEVEGSIMSESGSYAWSLNSYNDNDGTSSTHFPSLPAHLKIGDKFPCIACGRQVAKSQSGAPWRRHLLSDLRPWICCQLECMCEFKSFETRDEWVKHLQATHDSNPRWNTKECPFCERVIAKGGRDMMRHVERHLRQLSLAALTPNPEDGSEDSESELEPDTTASGPRMGDVDGDVEPSNMVTAPQTTANIWRDHPLYKNAAQEADGLWHCPYEGEDYCNHKPSVIQADVYEFLSSHLNALLCKVENCTANNKQPFATQEILYIHELTHHGMHKDAGRFLCTSPGCGRSRVGNGFMNQWVQLEHIRNVHDNLPDIHLPKDVL